VASRHGGWLLERQAGEGKGSRFAQKATLDCRSFCSHFEYKKEEAMTVATSFRADPQKIEALDNLAKVTGTTRNKLINRALDDLLEHQAWFAREVMIGIAEADRGEFATDEEVRAVFKKYTSRP
jgi:predicted transcriptional regulator